MRLVVLRVLEQDFVHVGGRILVELVGRAEDDEGDLAVAQDAQLVRLLHHSELAFVERHLEGDFKTALRLEAACKIKRPRRRVADSYAVIDSASLHPSPLS